MKAPALVTVDQPPEAYVALFDAARELGIRIGWLELGAKEVVRNAPAVEAGAAKAVTVGDERVVSVKRTRGPSVLRDLLREHFLGCAVVLIRGHEGAPRLTISGTVLRLEEAGGALELAAGPLLAHLLRPRYRG